jgi:redox-regulated HSP33 family molecular chaperone
MIATNSPDNNSQFAPSELVLLNGEKFAKKVLAGNVQLLHSQEKVSVAQLGQAMLAAAFLANERSGNIRLETRQKKAMLGLRKVTGLQVLPVSVTPAWPEHSFEAQIYSLVEHLGQHNEVNDVVYAWLGQDSGNPWNSVIELVKEGMAERGLLERSEEKKLKIFTSVKHELPQSTANQAAQEPITSIQQLLAENERDRRELWDLLVKEIKKGIKDRTEQSDIDMD